MGAVIEKHIQCDGYNCNKSTVDMRNPILSIKVHRRFAKADGWIFINGKDYCNECKECKHEWKPVHISDFGTDLECQLCGKRKLE